VLLFITIYFYSFSYQSPAFSSSPKSSFFLSLRNSRPLSYPLPPLYPTFTSNSLTLSLYYYLLSPTLSIILTAASNYSSPSKSLNASTNTSFAS
jgi:hypothetical protein